MRYVCLNDDDVRAATQKAEVAKHEHKIGYSHEKEPIDSLVERPVQKTNSKIS